MNNKSYCDMSSVKFFLKSMFFGIEDLYLPYNNNKKYF